MPTAVRTGKERFCTDRDAAIVCLNVDPIIELSEKSPPAMRSRAESPHGQPPTQANSLSTAMTYPQALSPMGINDKGVIRVDFTLRAPGS
jgi:hypothetical protein